MTRWPLPAASTFRRAILLAASLLALTRPAPAATIPVNTFAQGNVDAGCSLAEAITSANINDDFQDCLGVGLYGTDTIELQTGTYNLTAIDINQNGTPMITDPLGLTINGNGSTIARTVGGVAPFFRIFEVIAGPFSLNSLTLTGGNPGAGTNGGAVLHSSTGNLTVTGSTFSGNTAQDDGGAIHKSGSGNLTVTSSTFTNNTATNSGTDDTGDGAIGGGAIKIESSGTVSVTSNIFVNNRATSSGADASRGGALLDESSTSAINNNCFVGNIAQSGGGVFGDASTNAENNWWGAANGPSEAGPGSGDGVSTNVDFDPFLTIAPEFCAQPIPTLSEWAQFGMLILLAAGGLMALRRTKRAVPTRPA